MAGHRRARGRAGAAVPRLGGGRPCGRLGDPRGPPGFRPHRRSRRGAGQRRAAGGGPRLARGRAAEPDARARLERQPGRRAAGCARGRRTWTGARPSARRSRGVARVLPAPRPACGADRAARGGARGGRLTDAGPTALRDALFAGLQIVPPEGAGRPVMVLFSDGRDTASWMAAGDLAGVVRRSGVVRHAVEPVGPEARLRARARGRLWGINESRSLQRAVQAGGGRFWSAAVPDELKELFAAALDELRAPRLLRSTLALILPRPQGAVPPERSQGPPPRAAYPGPPRESRPTVARANQTRRR